MRRPKIARRGSPAAYTAGNMPLDPALAQASHQAAPGARPGGPTVDELLVRSCPWMPAGCHMVGWLDAASHYSDPTTCMRALGDGAVLCVYRHAAAAGGVYAGGAAAEGRGPRCGSGGEHAPARPDLRRRRRCQRGSQALAVAAAGCRRVSPRTATRMVVAAGTTEQLYLRAGSSNSSREQQQQ